MKKFNNNIRCIETFLTYIEDGFRLRLITT